MTWIAATGGYDVALAENKVVARNSAGKQLRSVPAALKDDPAVVGLRQLVEWLARHDRACETQVEAWMVRSLPVPLAVLAQIWPDPAWQRVLRDLIVRPTGKSSEVGFLRDASAAKGLGLVNLDGDSVFVKTLAVLLPHPVLLGELEEMREFATDLSVEQVVPQLFREVHHRPDGTPPEATSTDTWAGGQFDQLRHLTSRVQSLGYVVRGGFAALKLFENGRTLDARIWIGAEDPESPGETGDLGWVDDRGRSVSFGEVGPVAWSEGARMAARIYAGRKVEEAEVLA